jgi:hypothetical protein
MTKYLDSSPFTVIPGINKAFRENHSKVFGVKTKKKCKKCKEYYRQFEDGSLQCKC